MARRTIYDCDGVLADHTVYLLSKLDCGVVIDDCYEFSLRNVLKKLKGNKIARAADAICSQTAFTLSQPVLPWAHELVTLALAAGELLVVTAPWASMGWYDARVRWLKDELGINRDQVIVGRAKSWVNADLFVDDKPTNIIEWCRDNPHGRGVLLAWPYNASHPELPSNARRLNPEQLLEELRIGFVSQL